MAVHSYDLVIVGAAAGTCRLPGRSLTGGSRWWRANGLAAPASTGGCIPSKMQVHTADVARTVRHTVMRLGRLPRSMAVLGGGYIAAKMSHIFGSLGAEVTIVARGQYLVLRHDTDIRARFTELYQRRFDIRLGTTAERVSATRKGVRLSLASAAGLVP